jgi:hypothetical protein
MKKKAVATTTTTTSQVPTTTVMPTPAAPPPAAQDTCVKGEWPAAVQGRPAEFQSSANAAYLWHDPDGGWALRVTHSGPRSRLVFSGNLTTAGKFVDVVAVSGGSNDIVFESANKHAVSFRFVNYGLVDGLDFATQCAKAFSVTVHIGGVAAPADAVHLGATSVSPAGNPFKVQRLKATSTAVKATSTVISPSVP